MILCKDVKNVYGIVVIVFGIKVDIHLFIVQIPTDKLVHASLVTSKALNQSSITLKEI